MVAGDDVVGRIRMPFNYSDKAWYVAANNVAMFLLGTVTNGLPDTAAPLKERVPDILANGIPDTAVPLKIKSPTNVATGIPDTEVSLYSLLPEIVYNGAPEGDAPLYTLELPTTVTRGVPETDIPLYAFSDSSSKCRSEIIFYFREFSICLASASLIFPNSLIKKFLMYTGI